MGAAVRACIPIADFESLKFIVQQSVSAPRCKGVSRTYPSFGFSKVTPNGFEQGLSGGAQLNLEK
jgi:hypothetical protein